MKKTTLAFGLLGVITMMTSCTRASNGSAGITSSKRGAQVLAEAARAVVQSDTTASVIEAWSRVADRVEVARDGTLSALFENSVEDENGQLYVLPRGVSAPTGDVDTRPRALWTRAAIECKLGAVQPRMLNGAIYTAGFGGCFYYNTSQPAAVSNITITVEFQTLGMGGLGWLRQVTPWSKSQAPSSFTMAPHTIPCGSPFPGTFRTVADAQFIMPATHDPAQIRLQTISSESVLNCAVLW